MSADEKRRAKRFRVKFFMQYEKVLKDGSLALPVTVPARDISTAGISFYAAEKMDFHSKLKITFSVSVPDILKSI